MLFCAFPLIYFKKNIKHTKHSSSFLWSKITKNCPKRHNKKAVVRFYWITAYIQEK